MNFIKKKLKSHKKDDEEEEYEKAVYEQSLHPQTGDQKMKNTEEWQFFQQLSMKVQDTVQKTQTTLNKLKDIRQDSLSNPEDKDPYDMDDELLSKENSTADKVPPYGTTRVLRAPPRPPPPAADKPNFATDAEFASDFSQSSPAKGPPRPPPPGYERSSDLSFNLDSSALRGTPSKNFGSPARPPPPSTGRQEYTHVAESYTSSSESTILNPNPAAKPSASFSLLDEFGFKTDNSTTSNLQTNFQDLLFLDDKEETDPFDTSFVDVTNISSKSTLLNKETNDTGNKASEYSFNPFFSSAPSDNWMTTASSDFSSSSSKAATNPFFTGMLDEIKSEEKEEKPQLWSSHNPFGGDSNSAPISNAENDDFFGISINPTPSKLESNHIIGDTFQKNEQSFIASLQQNNGDDLLKSDFIMDKPLEINNITNEVTSIPEIYPLDINEDQSGVSSLKDVWVADEKQTSDAWVTEKKDVNDVWVTDEKDVNGVCVKDENEVGDVWITDKEEVNDVWLTNKNDEKNVDKAISKLEAPTEVKLSSEPMLDWDSDTTKSEIVLPEKCDVMDESSNPEQNDEQNPNAENVDFFDNNEVTPIKQPVENVTVFPTTETKLDEQNIETFSHENLNQGFSFNEDISSMEFNQPNATESFEQKSSIPQATVDPPNNFDFNGSGSKGNELNMHKIEAQFTTDNFSKPFDEENETSAFVFKVKTSDAKPNLDFDAFAAKFESAKGNQAGDAFDPFMSSKRAPTLKKIKNESKGFGSMDEFDPFKVTRDDEERNRVLKKDISRDSFEDYDNEMDFSVVIKPKVKDVSDVKPMTMEPPKLLPPPKTPTKAFETTAPRFNPFDKDFVDPTTQAPKFPEKTLEFVEVEEDHPVPALGEAGVRKADSIDTPLSPLFDEDTSLPLEVFPQPYGKEGWEMVLRQPNKKKLTGNRFWKKIFVKLSDNSVLQLFNKEDDKLPFQELPLQACYSLSEIGAQQYDQYGKIFTVKLQYRFYRERVGVRPGQISKVTQGQVTSMGDVAKLGLPLQHSPQTSQLLKVGSQYYKDIKLFIQEIEDALFRMVVHRDRVLTYKTEEVQVIAQDEFYVEQSKTGHIDKQLARVRIFFLAFITGMPSVEVGLNDINRQGKEVVGRYDIMPVVTEEWIRLEDCEFHSCVNQDEFQNNRVIKFHPPDACLFELLRFRIRPPKNRELPLQVRVFMTVSSTRVEIRSDILVPGYSSRKQGQVPCENIQIRFPVPECWIYLFRTEKHFRYGSKKSTARRPGKIKGLERIIGAAQNLDPSLIEVSAGQAKYEHVFHAVVWRIPRLPKEGQGAYTQQLFLLRTELTSFDQIPESFEQYVDVEFTMPATYVSHTTVRSVSVTNPIPPEKYVRYISKHEYKVEIEFKSSSDDIDGLMASPNVSIPVSTSPAVQESTEDEEKDDSD